MASDYRFEIWTRPESGTFERKRALHDVIDYRISDDFGAGKGWVDLPDSHPHLDEILYVDPANHANDVSSVIMVFNGETYLTSFWPSRMERRVADTGGIVRISGQGALGRLGKVVAFPYDYNTNPSITPDHIYGADGTGNVVNGGFEDNPLGVQNGDAETNSLTPWTTSDAAGVAATTAARNGTYHFTVTPSALDGGISQTVQVYPRDGAFTPSYTITAWVRQASGSGTTLELAATMEAGGTVSTGTYESTDGVVVDTVTGSTTYQQLQVVFTPGPSQTSTTITVRQSAGTLGAFYVDDVTISGFGVGADGWLPGSDTPGGMTFAASSSQANSGTYSLQLTADPGESAFQRIAVVEGGTFTTGIWAYSAAGADWALQVRTTLGNVIAEDAQTIAAATWTYFEVTYTVPDGIPEGDELLLVFVNQDSGQETVFLDDASHAAGLADATVGAIWGDLIADADGTDHAGRDALSWITKTFSDTQDSDSANWDQDRSVTIKRGQPYGNFLGFVARWGYEHNLRWDGTNWDFNVYNPGTMGTTQNVAIAGTGTVTGSSPIVRKEPEASYALVEGQAKGWGEDHDSTLSTAWGRMEVYEGSKELGADLADRAAQRTSDAADRSDGLRVTITSEVYEPWSDFNVGDSIYVGYGSELEDRKLRRIRAMTLSGGDVPTVTIDLDSEIFTGAESVSRGVEVLLRKFKGLEDDELAALGSYPSASGVKPGFTIRVAASDARAESKASADYVCDGVADEVEINQAIDDLGGTGTNTGGRVLLSEGTFTCSISPDGIIVNENDGIILEGMGMDATIIENSDTDTSQQPVIAAGAFTTIRNLAIIQNATYGNPVSAIDIQGDYVTVENVYIAMDPSGDCITCYTDDANIVIRRNIIESGANGMVLFTEEALVIDNHVTYTTEDGIQLLRNASRNIVSRNLVRGCGRHGIRLYADTNSMSGNLITNNWIYTNSQTTDDTYSGIRLDRDSTYEIQKTVVSHNTVRHDGSVKQHQYGIDIQAGAVDTRVFGNDLATSGRTGKVNDGGTGTLWGPSAEEWSLGTPTSRTDGYVIAWNTTNSYFELVADAGATPGTSVERFDTFTNAGTCSTGTGTVRLYNTSGASRTIQGCWAGIGTAPTGADLIVDVHKDGTTIYTTQGNRPTISAGSNASTQTTPDVTAWADGSYLTVDIDQVGSTVAGSDLTVTIEWLDS